MTTEEEKTGVVLFFLNLPWETTQDEVQALVKKESGIGIDAKLSTRKDGRSRGYATARVSDEDAETLMEMSEKIMTGDRAMKIERRRRRDRKRGGKAAAQAEAESAPAEGNKEEGEAKKPRRRNRKKNAEDDAANAAGEPEQRRKEGVLLFFGNVPWETTSEDLQVAIKKATGIATDVKISARKNGRSRGYGTARCSEPEAENLVAATDTIMLGDRSIRIEKKKRRERRRRKSEDNSDNGETQE